MSAIPIDFVLFALTLLGVALFHHHTLRVALTGLALITTYKVLASPFCEGAGLPGLASHLAHEWVVIANLGLLLTGFALLARHYEESGVPESLPRVLPTGTAGAFALLAALSSCRRSSTTSPPRSSARRWPRSCSRRCTSATSPRSSPPRTPAVPAASSATPRPR